MSLMPHTSFGLQILSHLTHTIFLSFEPHPQRKFLWTFTSLAHTLVGNLQKDKYYIGNVDSTYLIKHDRPTILISLPFQLDKRLLTFSIIGCQNCLCLGFPPIGNPRYTNEIFICLQFRVFEKIFIIDSSKPITPTLVLDKLTLSPDANSKLYSTTFKIRAF